MKGQLLHSVFFTLKDPSDEAQAALVAACHEFLEGHPGCVYFGVGTRAAQYVRDVNDQTFHVGMTSVFESAEAHDKYQISERHVAFIESQSPTWAAVRVFDAQS